MEHDTSVALRLTVALAPWWLLRGRLAGQYPLLRQVAERAEPGSNEWCIAQFWLGSTARFSADLDGALDHFTAMRDAIQDQGPPWMLADALIGRSSALRERGQIAEAAEDARSALALAREAGYPGGEALALVELSQVAYLADDLGSAVQLARQAGQITTGIPGRIGRRCSAALASVLIDAGDLAAAADVCATALVRCREAGQLEEMTGLLVRMALLDVKTGRFEDAAACLQEGIRAAARISFWFELLNGLDCCGFWCAPAGRHAEAVTVWAAWAALSLRGVPHRRLCMRASGGNRCVTPGKRSDRIGPGRQRNAARR
jgi:tetratricopeptide (TPR) repeat protein